ncbi:radical SAM protein [Fusobacterium ulcerans]|uniref:radical SAM protein n=1 Tax=Fusobacterium ulcerans TaxID=861 RepID=UPI0026EA4BB2|nr:radical SAM protein [Fusobacterium ulcerans]
MSNRMYLYLTNECNKICEYCYQNDHNINYEKEISYADIVDFLKKTLPKQTILFGGEPTLKQELIRKIITSFTKTEYIITTNGILLDEMLDIVKNNVFVQFSINSVEDIKFYDKDNKLTDYDPSLVRIISDKSENNEDLSKYKYENKTGDKKLYLPEKVSTETPILLENEDNQIKIAPIVENNTSKVNIEKQKTINIYDDEVSLPIKANYEDNDTNTTYEYISQDNGVKENLILNEKPESNVFQYEITVNDNLIPKKCEIEESIIFCKNDNEENVIASIDMPFMNDKTGKAYSDDITYDIEKSKYDDNKYILTMTLSQDYLNDKDRVYPVTVDPSITWIGDSNLIDTYILSNSKYADTNFYNSGTWTGWKSITPV